MTVKSVSLWLAYHATTQKYLYLMTWEWGTESPVAPLKNIPYWASCFKTQLSLYCSASSQEKMFLFLLGKSLICSEFGDDSVHHSRVNRGCTVCILCYLLCCSLSPWTTQRWNPILFRNSDLQLIWSFFLSGLFPILLLVTCCIITETSAAQCENPTFRSD